MKYLKLKRTWAALAALGAIIYIVMRFNWLMLVGVAHSSLIKAGWELPPTILPEETADKQSLERLLNWDRISYLEDSQHRQTGSYQRVQKPYNFWMLPDSYVHAKMPLKWKDNDDSLNFVCKGKNSRLALTGFATPHFDKAECDEDYVKGAVLARFEGSGKLVRFWMTALSAFMEDVNEEVLRIYIDDKEKPLLQVPLKDVFLGEHEIFADPFGAEEFSYVAWYYPVVFSKKIIIAIDQLGPYDLYYHQTNVILDKEPVVRQPLAVPAGAKLRKKIINNLSGDDYFALPKSKPLLTQPLPLVKGKPFAVSIAGPATIQELKVELPFEGPGHTPDDLKGIRLEITWDGLSQPSVEGRLGDLFAFEYDIYERNNGPLNVSRHDNDLILRLRFPMPFNNKATFRLISGIEKPIPAILSVTGTSRPKTQEQGYFRSFINIKKHPAATRWHTMADIKGKRGRYVGTCAQMKGRWAPGEGHHLQYSFLEGDERGFIDGKLAIRGTGAEDYFNASFYYLKSPFSTHYAAWWGKVRESKKRERMSQCRFHILGDEINFQESFKLELENGGANPAGMEENRTTAYYYVAP